MTDEAKVIELENIISELSNDRKWCHANDASIHRPNNKFIMIDMDEFKIVNNFYRSNKYTFNRMSELMFERILDHLLYSTPKPMVYWKGIEIHFRIGIGSDVFNTYTL